MPKWADSSQINKNSPSIDSQPRQKVNIIYMKKALIKWIFTRLSVSFWKVFIDTNSQITFIRPFIKAEFIESSDRCYVQVNKNPTFFLQEQMVKHQLQKRWKSYRGSSRRSGTRKSFYDWTDYSLNKKLNGKKSNEDFFWSSNPDKTILWKENLFGRSRTLKDLTVYEFKLKNKFKP